VQDAVFLADTVEDMASIAGERPRFFGRSANAMPLSVSTVWMA